MATSAAARIAVPSFTGLRGEVSAKVVCKPTAVSIKSIAPRASLESAKSTVGKALVATGASLLFAFSANADTLIKMGGDAGELIFSPDSVSVSKGETIVFKNNKGFPHNVIFDDVPDGVDPDSISHEDNFEALGDGYKVKLDVAGTYTYYCLPHYGAPMKGKITVS